MVSLLIDGQPVEVAEGATILDAARKLGLQIPTLCHRNGQSDGAQGACDPLTSCMVCVVRVNGAAKLSPSCATKAANSMRVESETPEVKAARKTALELLLADHAGDCLAPCQLICPAHMNIPLMLKQIERGELRQAVATVKKHIPLPSTLGRICPDLCEKGCRRADKDSSVSICKLKRFVGDTDLASPEPYVPQKAAPTGKRVIIVGAGPTGLSAAYYLLVAGHSVTVYDDHLRAGGAMRYAVPRDLLPEKVLDDETRLIQQLGATFVLGGRIGEAVFLEDLRKQSDAVLLAVGPIDIPKAKALGVPGTNKGLTADKQTFLTPLPGVFAAGAATGAYKFAARAVGDGHAAAAAIDDFLHGRPIQPRESLFSTRLGSLNEIELAQFLAGSTNTPRVTVPGDRYMDIPTPEAAPEAARCLACGCAKVDTCRLRLASMHCDADPNHFKGERRPFERVSTHPAIVFESGKCISCGICVQIAQQAGEKLGLTYIGRGFTLRIGAPLGADVANALTETAAACAKACPTAAIALKSTV